jgi:effector-binding domain-containing protein
MSTTAATTITTPRLETRPARPCVVIRNRVTMAQLPTDLPPQHGELARWLGARGLAPSGPPFFRYPVIDMEGLLTVDVGFPVAKPVEGDGRVLGDTIAAGPYLVAMYHGHPRGLERATGELLDWAGAHGVTWDKQPEGRGEAWRSRIEWYLDDNRPDMNTWDTELAFLTR